MLKFNKFGSELWEKYTKRYCKEGDFTTQLNPAEFLSLSITEDNCDRRKVYINLLSDELVLLNIQPDGVGYQHFEFNNYFFRFKGPLNNGKTFEMLEYAETYTEAVTLQEKCPTATSTVFKEGPPKTYTKKNYKDRLEQELLKMSADDKYVPKCEFNYFVINDTVFYDKEDALAVKEKLGGEISYKFIE